MHRATVDRDRLLVQIDVDRSDLEHWVARRPCPAQRSAQASQQLAHRERLRHVIVGAGVERRDLFRLVADRRDEHDRRLAPGAQLSADLGSGSVGQQQVEDHRVRWSQPCCSERLLRSRGGLDLVARAAQVRFECAQKLRLVVDDEDVGHDGARAGKRSAGSTRRAVMPPPVWGCSSTEPLFTSAKPRAIERPIPAPGAAAPPRSSTSTTSVSPSARALTSTVSRENLSALSIRFTSTRWIWTSSTRAGGSPSGIDISTRALSRTSEIARGTSSSIGQRAACGTAAPTCSRDRSSRFSTSRVNRAPSNLIVSSSAARSPSVKTRSLLCKPSTAAAIVASGVRKSCETLCSTAVLIASDCRSVSSRSRSSATWTRAATAASNRRRAIAFPTLSTASERARLSSSGRPS